MSEEPYKRIVSLVHTLERERERMEGVYVPTQLGHNQKREKKPRRAGDDFSSLDHFDPPSSEEEDGGNIHIAKMCLCGNAGVGKSSLMKRYCDNTFLLGAESTIGVDFRYNTVEAQTGERIKFCIWDTAGQERFRSVTQSYFRGANVILFVFDLGSDTSFKAIVQWLVDADWTLREDDRFGTDNEYTRAYLIGNKSDLGEEGGREVSSEVATSYAKSMCMDYLEVSCKEGTNVRESLQSIADHLAQQNTEWIQAGKGPVFKNKNKRGLRAVGSNSRGSGSASGCAC